MSAKKRGCSTKKDYSRTNCLIDKSVESAGKTCQCRPWFVNSSEEQCDIFGSKCFMDNFAKEMLTHSCLESCSAIDYTMALQFQNPISLLEDLGQTYGQNITRLFLTN